MNSMLKSLLTVVSLAFATHAVAQAKFYEREGFVGQYFSTEQQIANFKQSGFNDWALSVEVFGGSWEVCEDIGFRGRCAVLRPGRYPSLTAMGLNNRVASTRAISRELRGDDTQHRHPSAPQITFYEHERFLGESFTTERSVDNFGRFGFNDRASSVEVSSGWWHVCGGAEYRGQCAVLGPGRYPTLVSLGLNERVSSARVVSPNARTPDAGQVRFYEHEGFLGQYFSTDRPVANFARFGFNDRASSIEVFGEMWEVCEEAQFKGRCVVLRPGRYPSLASMGLNDRISSVRAAITSARSD